MDATRWIPDVAVGGEPIYRQIARALADDIRSGVLPPGSLLPPQRELAAALSVSVATVTKAYKEMGRLHLVVGRARAGTQVVRRVASVAGWRGLRPDGAATVDMASNSVATSGFLHELATSLSALAGSDRFADLQEYPPVAGHPHHRAVIAQWLSGRGLLTAPEQVVLTGGAHQALFAVLFVLGQENPTLLAEALTYAPLMPLARALRVRTLPLDMDAHGVDPDDAVRVMSRARKPALFLTPNINNPTTATLSVSRRKALVSAARRYGAWIVEDDVYGLLADQKASSLAAMAPERVFHLGSFAKSVAPGLRVGFVRAPDPLSAEKVATGIGIGTRMAPTLYAEIVCQWITDGTLDRIVGTQRKELERRVRLVLGECRDFDLRTARFGPHVWLKLPRHCGEEQVVRNALKAGVSVLPSQNFSVRNEAVHALRLAITAPRSHDELMFGLRSLRDAISSTGRRAS